MTVVVLGVLWLPAIIQQAADEPGNVGTLVRFFRDHGREQAYGDAWHVVANQLGAWPDWVRGATDLNVIGALDFEGGAAFPFALALLVGAIALAWRYRCTDALLLDALAAALVVASFIAATRVVDEVFPYLVKWTWVVGALVWIAIAWSAIAAMRTASGGRRSAGRSPRPRRRDRTRRGVVRRVHPRRRRRRAPPSRACHGASPDSPRRSRRSWRRVPGRGVVEIRMMDSPDSIFGGAGSLWTGAGIADLLDQHDVDVRVAPDLAFAYTPDYVVGADDQVRLEVMPVDRPELPRVDRNVWREVARAGETTIFVRARVPLRADLRCATAARRRPRTGRPRRTPRR